MRRNFRLLIVTAMSLVATPALADSIDGDWCFTDGRNFSIKGPEITTPTGKHLRGDYTRHTFDYMVPAAEPDAGKRVQMSLMGEYAVQVTPPGGRTEIWRRCELKTS